jgi:putative addiction module component (TIGR02574 family)
MAKPALDIDELTADERLDLLEKLWDSLSDHEVPMTDAQRDELDRRMTRLEAQGPIGIPWKQVKSEMGGSG